MLISRRALVCATLLLLAAAPAPRQGIPVALSAQPGTPADRAARQLVAEDLRAARERGDAPLLLVGTADLGGDRPALFVQLQSPGECGSAGCTTTVYAYDRGGWRRVLDGTTGKLTVASKRTKGRADLLSDGDRYVWNGTAYASTSPAPAVNLAPQRPAAPRRGHHRHHQAGGGSSGSSSSAPHIRSNP